MYLTDHRIISILFAAFKLPIYLQFYCWMDRVVAHTYGKSRFFVPAAIRGGAARGNRMVST